MEFRVLAVGDVVASSGLAFLKKQLRGLKKLCGAHFCVVNGENASNIGLTPDQAEDILDAGGDVVTLGNHAFGRREICNYLDDVPYILRPANYAPQLPGRGMGVYDSPAGPVAVLNLIGRCGMDFAPDNPFLMVERLLKDAGTRLILVDMHAEATSEKLAMGYLLDGRVSAVWGTHTHVPTADAQILPRGTGYVTDLGMTGPAQSVIGLKPELSIAKFRGDLIGRYEPAPGPCKLNAVLFTIDTQTGLCTAAERMDVS